MADENIISNVIQWSDDGVEKVMRDADAVGDAVVKATEKINDAGDAIDNFKEGVGDIPDIPTPAMPIPFDTDEVKAATKSIEQASDKMIDTGKASEVLFSALDSLVPGLGKITESLFSLNPLAIAGTAAVVGLSLAFAEIQKKAEAARAASEAQAKAEAERVLQEIDLTQRTNLALEGDKAAREKIITDLADFTQQRDSLAQRGAENAKAIAEQLAIIEKYTNFKPEAGLSDADRFKAFTDAQAKLNDANAKLATFNETATDLAAEMTTVNDQFNALTDAAKKVGISAAEQAAVNKAIEVGTDGAVAALNRLWGEMGTATDAVNDLSSGVSDSFKNLAGDLKDMQNAATAAAAEAAKAAKDREAAEERLLKINEDLTNAEMDRGKTLADRLIEDSRASELAKLDQRLKYAQEFDAQQQRNKKVAELQQQGHTEEIEAQQKFMTDQMKLLDGYRDAEKKATEDYSTERLRKLDDLYNSLLDLSSKRDVAGFVNARRAGLTDIARGDEDAGVDARRRREQYERAAQEQVSAFNKENSQRQAQLQQRIQQEEQAGRQELTATQRAQAAIADLRAQYAKQDLAARRLQEDLSYRQTVDILQRKRADELKITAGAAAGVIDFISRIRDAATQLGSGLGQIGARGIPRYASGTDFITRPGLAYLDYGESVKTAAENARSMRGADRPAMNLTIQMSVGEHVSQADLSAVENRIVSAVERFAGSR